MRTPLVTVPGAAMPYPFGGKQRQVQIDLDPAALQARGLSAQDVANALAAQNQITPVGTQKIGQLRIHHPAQQRAVGDRGARTTCRSRRSTARRSIIRDVANVRDGNPPQTNIVHVDGNRSVLMTVLKNGAASTLDIIAGIKEKLADVKDAAAGQPEDRLHRRPVAVRPRRDQGVARRRRDRRGADQRDDPAVPRQLALDRDHRDLDPAGDPRRDHACCRRSARRSTS